MYFEDVRQWQGTAETITKELKRQAELLRLSVELPVVRTIRSWRAKQILSQPKGQEFGYRQILEGLSTALLLKKGWTLTAIAQVLPSFSDDALEKQLISEAEGHDFTWSPTTSFSIPAVHRQAFDVAEDAVVLLAQGILRQYDRVLSGREIVRQQDSMPVELYKAMCKLGRLYIEEGKRDRAACIHDVLERARYSLDSDEWELEIFRQPNFRFSSVTLIDPDLRVPTSDCSAIANLSGGYGEDNVIEHRLYAQLRSATERLGSRLSHKAYTVLRELFGRHSLIAEHQLLDYLLDNDLTPLQGMIVDNFFNRVPDLWLINGLAHKCAYCGTLMRPHPHKKLFPEGRCPIRLCIGHDAINAKFSQRLNPKENRLLIAKSQILNYWTGPAIDELAIFDAARQKGLSSELYPESDLCDVSINERVIGIDAKSYTSPVSLALRLNRSIGGLSYYRRRIIAISDRLIEQNPNYLSTLKSTLDKKGDTATLEIHSVSSVIEFLKGMPYANQV